MEPKREDRSQGGRLQLLRTTLLTLMVMELVARLEKLQDSKDKCRQQGWLNEEEKMMFQIWDQEKKRLVALADQEQFSIAAVLKILRDITPLINPHHVLKFHAQRPLKGMTEAENKAVFNLEISLRAPERSAPTVWPRSASGRKLVLADYWRPAPTFIFLEIPEALDHQRCDFKQEADAPERHSASHLVGITPKKEARQEKLCIPCRRPW